MAYANLAQTYIRVTHYSESDRELRAAAAHGMADIARRRALWRDESEPVFDATLPRATLLQQARDEIRRQPAQREASVQTWRSSPWRGLRPGLSTGTPVIPSADQIAFPVAISHITSRRSTTVNIRDSLANVACRMGLFAPGTNGSNPAT